MSATLVHDLIFQMHKIHTLSSSSLFNLVGRGCNYLPPTVLNFFSASTNIPATSSTLIREELPFRLQSPPNTSSSPSAISCYEDSLIVSPVNIFSMAQLHDNALHGQPLCHLFALQQAFTNCKTELQLASTSFARTVHKPPFMADSLLQPFMKYTKTSLPAPFAIPSSETTTALPTVSIIINHCREPLDFLSTLSSFSLHMNRTINLRVYLYEKCDNRTMEELHDAEYAFFHFHRIIRTVLPNIGYEAHTYIYHILQTYQNDTSTLSLFTQADLFHDTGTNLVSLSTLETYILQMLEPTDKPLPDPPFPYSTPLGVSRLFRSLPCSYGFAVHDSFLCPYDCDVPIPKIWLYEYLFGTSPPPSHYCVALCANFFAHRTAIHSRSYSFYQRAMHILNGQFWLDTGIYSLTPFFAPAHESGGGTNLVHRRRYKIEAVLFEGNLSGCRTWTLVFCLCPLLRWFFIFGGAGCVTVLPAWLFV